MKSHLYLVLSALKRIRENPKLHLLSIFTIMICFYIVGAGLMAFYQIKLSLNQTSEQQWVYVYLDSAFDEAKKDTMMGLFCNKPWVEQCKFVSRSQAEKTFIAQYPEMKTSLDALGENPFPASVEIRLKNKMEDKEVLPVWFEEIRSSPQVSEVDDGGKWLTQWIDLLHFFDRFTYVLVFVVGLMIVGLVSNTITLLMYSKKDEIGILQLVGATPSMIRFPSLLSAALYGFVGSIVALLLLHISFIQLAKYLTKNYSALLPEVFSFMSLFDQVFLVLVAILVSVIGAWISTQSYLSKRDIT